MKFGLSFSVVVPPDGPLSWSQVAQDMVNLAPEVEALGFDSLHVLEHHFQKDGWNPSPLLTLAAVSAVTTTLGLTTDILVATLYNPVKLAEDTAVLDNLSNGRLTLGVAPGYVSEEFAGLMVPFENRVRRFEECMDIIQAAWTQDEFSYDGEFFKIPPTSLMPRPLQNPHPPIWYGVSGPKMLIKAAERNALFVGSPRHTVPELKEHVSAYRVACEQVGFTPTELPIGRGLFIAPTRQEAIDIAGPAVTHLFRELYARKSAEGARELRSDDGTLIVDSSAVDFETFQERYIIGTPDDAIERIQQLRDEVGMTELVAWTQLPGISGDQAIASARLLAKHVIPEFK
jgi:alkanesulfonate monooxygenase SsuD/methylene tetrahydromethanopterin reductase-like flavin-dependent oxidoreductase (luciferase family)